MCKKELGVPQLVVSPVVPIITKTLPMRDFPTLEMLNSQKS